MKAVISLILLLTCIAVNEGRMKPKIDIYPKVKRHVYVGDSALFQCRVIAGSPPIIAWSRADGILLSEKVGVMDNNVILIKKVTPAEQGSYVCTATNEMGTTNATATLLVTAELPTVSVAQNRISIPMGADGSLLCTVTGNPQPNVTWIHLGERISSNNKVLTITQASMTDSGIYVCRAENAMGIDQDWVIVDIERA